LNYGVIFIELILMIFNYLNYDNIYYN